MNFFRCNDNSSEYNTILYSKNYCKIIITEADIKEAHKLKYGIEPTPEQIEVAFLKIEETMVPPDCIDVFI